VIKDNTEHVSYEEYVIDDKPDKKDSDKLVTYFRNLMAEYESSEYRKKKIEESDESRKQYDGYRATKNFPWPGCANYSMMIPAIVVDNLEPRLVASVAGKDRDIIEVIANSEKGVQYTRPVEQFAEWALSHNIKWQSFVPAWVHDVLLDGTGYIFPRYEEKKLKRGQRFVGNVTVDAISGERLDAETLPLYAQARLPITQQYVDEIQQKDVRIFKVVNEYASINEVYGPDLCPDWDETPTIRQQFVKYEDLEAQSTDNGGVYINITEDLKKDRNSTRSNDALPIGSSRDGAKAEELEERGDIEILTLYDKRDIGEGRDWCIITLARSSETIIRKQYVRDVYYGLEGKPVKRLIIFPDYGKQNGTSIVQKIRHFTGSINDCLNQMIDSGTVQINPWFFYGSDAGLQDELDISPGGANPVVGNANSIVFPQLGVKANLYIEFINLITAYLERLVALSSYQSGAEDQVMGQGAGTAAGMRMILQEAQIKHTYQAKPIKEQLGEIIKLDMLLYAWYMPTDVDMVLPGGDVIRKVNIDALQQDYDFTLRISDSAYNQMMARYEAQELLALAAQLPFVNQVQMFQDVLTAYDKKNAAQYIDQNFMMLLQVSTQNPEIIQVVQQYMQSKAQQQHMNELQQAAQDGTIVTQMKDKMKEQTMIPDLMKQVQKGIVKDGIQHGMKMEAALQHRDMVGPKEIQDAMASKRREIAKNIVDGSIE
jgi:hypothetical protein